MKIQRLVIPQRVFGEPTKIAPDVNDIVDKVDELVDAVNAGLATSNAIVGGDKYVRYLSSQTYGVPADALTLDRLDPSTILPGATATVINPHPTPLTATAPSAYYRATIVPVGTAGAVLVPAFTGSPDTVPMVWVEIVSNDTFTPLLASEVNLGKDAYAGLNLRPLLIALVNGIGTGSTTVVTTPAPSQAVLGPTVTGFLPDSAAVGASVTVTGTGFTKATAVLFNGTPASFQIVNATTILAVVPVGATTGPVAVTNSAGTGISTASFTVKATAPVGDTVAPNVSFTVPAPGATLTVGTQVILTATATDNVAVQGVAFTNGATGAALGSGAKNGNTYTLPYTPTAAGPLSLVATATDAAGNSQTATVNVTVQATSQPNTPPVANAGSDLSIQLPTNQVQLQGAGSDAEGPITSLWSQVSGPSSATLATPAALSTLASGLIAGSYTFRLAVTDNAGETKTDDVTITVVAAGSKFGNDLHAVGDSLTGYGGVNSDPDGLTTGYVAQENKRFADAGHGDLVVKKHSFPGYSAKWFLTNTSYFNGQTPLQNLLSQIDKTKIVTVQVWFGANPSPVDDNYSSFHTASEEIAFIRQIHQQLKAGGVDYTIGTPILPRADYFWPNGVPARLTKNNGIIAGKGVWCDEVAHYEQVPQLYSEEACNNATYYSMADQSTSPSTPNGNYKVHLTTAGYGLAMEQHAQAVARLLGFVLPPLVTARASVFETFEQDDSQLTFSPGGNWTSISPNPQYSGGLGAASSNEAGAWTEVTIVSYGIRFTSPRSNGGPQTVELVVTENGQVSGAVVDTGTEYSAAPGDNADPIAEIVSITYATLAQRTFRMRMAAGVSADKHLFVDSYQTPNAQGAFPPLPKAADPPTPITVVAKWKPLASDVTVDSDGKAHHSGSDAWGKGAVLDLMIPQPTGGAVYEVLLGDLLVAEATLLAGSAPDYFDSASGFNFFQHAVYSDESVTNPIGKQYGNANTVFSDDVQTPKNPDGTSGIVKFIYSASEVRLYVGGGLRYAWNAANQAAPSYPQRIFAGFNGPSAAIGPVTISGGNPVTSGY